MANAATSAAVHRAARGLATDLSDVADGLAIVVWIITNALLAGSAPWAPASAGLVFAGMCAVLNHARLKQRFGCRRRVVLHGAMHVCGALGTAVLVPCVYTHDPPLHGMTTEG